MIHLVYKKLYQNFERINFFVIQLFKVKISLLQSKDLFNRIFINESFCFSIYSTCYLVQYEIKSCFLDNMDQNNLVGNLISMDTSSTSVENKSENNDLLLSDKSIKRKNNTNDLSTVNKRSKLFDMVFYDGNRHPAAVLHELRPEISSDKYHFELEETAPKQSRFRCSLIIDQNITEAITAVGIGRSKQLAKNMAAQVH